MSAFKERPMRYCVPSYERMKQLHAFGHTNHQICEILTNEFADIDFNPVTPTTIKKIIEEHREEFDAAKMEMGIYCRERIQRQLAHLFTVAEEREVHLVKVYTDKLAQALDQLSELDLDERDDDGNFKNTSRVFVLIEMIEKLQSKVSKIVGTDALREIEIYRQKMEAKARAEESKANLLPPQANGRVVEEPSTRFI